VPRVHGLKRELREWWAGVDRGERLAVGGAMALTAAIVVAYVLATRPNELGGDQAVYDAYGKFWADGRLWWSDLPYGDPHASAWKAPLYPAWVGIIYSVLGEGPAKVAILQGLTLAPLTVLGAWVLARRLFGRRTAIATAYVVAIFPLSWEYMGLLYPEAMAIPLALLALNLVLERPPTTKLAVATGAAVALAMLVRPNMFFLLAGALAAWWIAAGPKRALASLAIAIGTAVLIIAPWTIRNLSAADGFVPISIQDAAVYGTFNDDAANDPVRPYEWRPVIDPMPEVFDEPGSSDAEVRRELIGEATDYISEHPLSVLEAFYWNGLSRFWDVRRPGRAIDDVEPGGQNATVALPGFLLYWVALALAIWGLWKMRRRVTLVVPLLLIALAASITVIPDAATRYRAPLEPAIVMLACAAVLAPAGRGSQRSTE
jgi:4-amino-4-deoxy-L-arabinose transferase-like glycosyltransferase